MDGSVKVEISVRPQTAEILRDAGRLRAIGHLVDLMVDPARTGDPLERLLEETRGKAREIGLSDAEIDAELEAFRAERAARRG